MDVMKHLAAALLASTSLHATPAQDTYRMSLSGESFGLGVALNLFHSAGIAFRVGPPESAPRVTPKFNAAARREVRVKPSFNEAAKPEPRLTQKFNEAARPPDNPPPGGGGRGGKAGGSDPPPSPRPPDTPKFKPPSI